MVMWLDRQYIKSTYLDHRCIQTGPNCAVGRPKWQCLRKCAQTAILYTTGVSWKCFL